MSKQIMNKETDKTRGLVDVLQEGDITKPPLLYKYYALNEWTQDIFENNEIYFSSPESFNDPFDSKMRFSSEGSRTDIKCFIRTWGPKHRPDLSRKQHLEYEKSLMKPGSAFQLIQEYVQENFLAYRGRMGVFSMTEERENILMWSHYAAEHTGFCIELQTDNNFFSRARHVEYDIDLPCLDLLEPMWDKQIAQGVAGLLTKARNWAYEKEWRIVDVDGVGAKKYPPEALSSVILGCKMSRDNKKQIKEWCGTRRLRPALYEAKEKEQEFGLDIIPVG